MQFKNVQPWYLEITTIVSIHCNMQVYHGVSHAGRTKVGWSLRDTASLLDISVGTVSEAIRLHALVQHEPSIIFLSKREALKRL